MDLTASVGLDFAKFGGGSSGGTELQYKAGFVAGGAAAYRLTSMFALQTEFGFVAKGYRSKGASAGTSSRRYMAYLEFPLLMRATLPISARVRPYVTLGPALAILLDADVTYDDGRYFEINDNVETFDLGLMAGLGTTVDLGRDAGAIAVDVRYNHGLLNWSVALSDESEGVYNRAFYVTVGYRADLATLGRLLGGRGDGKRPAEEAPRKPDPPPAAVESTPVPPSPAPGGPDS